MLQALGIDIVHLREELPPNTKDVDWIPHAAKNGYVALTSDVNISRVSVEVAALAKSGLIVFFMPSSFANLDLFEQASKLCKAWKAIEIAANVAKPGDLFSVTIKNGKVERKQAKIKK